MNLLESHIEGAQEFAPREREKIYRAIIEYLYLGIEPDYLKGNCKGYFIAIRPSLDKCLTRREAGRKGGKQKRSKTEANAKQSESKRPSNSDSDSEDLSNDKSKEVKEIVAYLNEKTGRSFKESKKTVEHINARLSEGYSVDDFKRVVDNKVAEWLHDPYWSKFLQPSTLFSLSHFDEYLNQTTLRTEAPDERFAKYAD